MHFFNTLKSYLLEYALVNKVRISVFAHKKQELLNTKWPCFINLMRIQIAVGIIQLLVNFILFEMEGNYQTLLLDVAIAVAQNIIDRCLLMRVSENKKIIIIVLLNISHCAYITTIIQFGGEQTHYLELLYRLMLCIVLINTQPLLACKYLIFVSYYVFICRFLSLWSQNFNDFVIILVIFILYSLQEEQKFRKLIYNSIIPNQIINALPLPVFLIKLETLEIIAYNQQFSQLVELENIVLSKELQVTIKQIEKLLTKFKLMSNQKLFNLIDSEQMNLYDAIQMIQIKQGSGSQRNSTFNYSFSIDEIQMFNILFQSGIVFNNNQCVLISISDISLIIERTKVIERTAFKSQLIKSLSHELRTRKNIIQGLLKLYLDQSEKQPDLIKEAYNNSKIESNIISSIINYNLCIEDQVIVNYSLTRVNELLDRVIDTFKFEAMQKQINIVESYPDTDFSLYTDSDIFEQIITNIISNSIKHCDKQNQSVITISIQKEKIPRTEMTLNQNQQNKAYKYYKENKSSYSSFQSVCDSPDTLETALNIKIVDNGSGINENKLRLIEEILKNDNYFQFQCKSDGFYLGLRSCNLLLQRLNKQNKLFLSIKSTENEGTEIILRFLVLDFSNNDYNVAVEEGIQQVRFAKQTKSGRSFCECMRTILIVDDEPFNNIILEQILLQLGYKVKKANNGQEALKLYKQQSNFCTNDQCRLFFAIFMDYQMPIMNGLESSKAIIQESRRNNRPQTHIIGCTAFSSKEDIDELLNAGIKYVCIKPISKDSIKQSLSFYQ